MNKNNFNDDIFTFYAIPFLSNFAILSIITGESKWGPYKNELNSIQVRLFGLFVLFCCIYITYSVLIKWPSTSKKDNIGKQVIKEFFSSLFFYLWVASFYLAYLINFSNSNCLTHLLYYIFMVICFIFQLKFIKKIKGLI